MRFLAKVMIKGVVIVLPIGLTIYFAAWLILLIEQSMGKPLEYIVGFDIPGAGLVITLLLMLLVGLLSYWGVFRRIVDLISHLLDRVPLVKSLYGGLCDLTSFISRAHEHAGLSHVVMYQMTDDCSLLGFVTREDFNNLPSTMSEGTDCIAVYLPMSYQIGGFTIFVPKNKVKPIDMSVEDAMRFAVTAGMSTKKDNSILTIADKQAAK